MSKHRRSDSSGSSQVIWEELLVRLQRGVIVAEDDANCNVEYFIMPGDQSPRTSSQEDEGDTRPVTETASVGTAKKSKEVYHLIVNEKKGSGGFGVVYKVRYSDSAGRADTDICLKQARDQSWDTLIRENDIFSHLNEHPHDSIIRRTFLCRSPHDIFLGLEFFEGYTLSEWIAVHLVRKLQFDHEDLVMVLKQQTEAIEHLQNNGVFHCDIKPENIIYNPNVKKSKLIDFGLAVFKYGVSSRFKSAGGTTEYMAPETLVDAELCIGTDLYGLGAALFHLITLETPWHCLEDIKAIKAVKLDPKLPNYQQLKATRRKEYREAIKAEIRDFRASLTEENANDVYMIIQRILMDNRHCAPNVISIVCGMLHHNPEQRPACNDILHNLRTSVSSDKLVNKQISNMAESERGDSSGRRSSATGTTDNDDISLTSGSKRYPVVVNYHDSKSGTESSIHNLLMDVSQPIPGSAPALSMLNKESSQIYQPDGEDGYPSAEMQSASQSVSVDPSGMSDYISQMQISSKSSMHFSMPHSERYDNVQEPNPIADHTYVRHTKIEPKRVLPDAVDPDGVLSPQLSPGLAPSGPTPQYGTIKSPNECDDDYEDEDL